MDPSEVKEIISKELPSKRKPGIFLGEPGILHGARSDEVFRNSYKQILQQLYEIEIVIVLEYDEEGEVYGRPDEIELDLITTNDIFIICEIRSLFHKADIHFFERKAGFYEKRHNRKATRLMIISPMIDGSAKALADRLGITVYSYPEDVEPSTFS